jgi:hypothetical protein
MTDADKWSVYFQNSLWANFDSSKYTVVAFEFGEE